MYIGRVVGTVVATIKHPAYQGYKLLTVARESLSGELEEKYDIALDTVQAGMGDWVLVMDEGNSARQVLGMEPWGPVRAVIVGIVDEVEVKA
ncbi:MAG: EutN/CcmL family microcompartment protein [Chloroflexi bacterium]|nr:EutN/CcmL family microcompartment protein [Chloroflexota bacterium]